jgi:hypothetical protein
VAGLKWIRLETSMFENPKLLYLQEDKQYRTIVTYLQGMCYSASRVRPEGGTARNRRHHERREPPRQ